jgi:hypothetical protein
MNGDEDLLGGIVALELRSNLRFVVPIGLQKPLDIFDRAGNILVVEWSAQPELSGTGQFTAIWWHSHLPLDADATHEPGRFCNKPDSHTVARSLSFDNDVVEISGGEEAVDGIGYVGRTQWLAVFKRQSFSEIGRIEKPGRRELNPFDPLALEPIRFRSRAEGRKPN